MKSLKRVDKKPVLRNGHNQFPPKRNNKDETKENPEQAKNFASSEWSVLGEIYFSKMVISDSLLHKHFCLVRACLLSKKETLLLFKKIKKYYLNCSHGLLYMRYPVSMFMESIFMYFHDAVHSVSVLKKTRINNKGASLHYYNSNARTKPVNCAGMVLEKPDR